MVEGGDFSGMLRSRGDFNVKDTYGGIVGPQSAGEDVYVGPMVWTNMGINGVDTGEENVDGSIGYAACRRLCDASSDCTGFGVQMQGGSNNENGDADAVIQRSCRHYQFSVSVNILDTLSRSLDSSDLREQSWLVWVKRVDPKATETSLLTFSFGDHLDRSAATPTRYDYDDQCPDVGSLVWMAEDPNSQTAGSKLQHGVEQNFCSASLYVSGTSEANPAPDKYPLPEKTFSATNVPISVFTNYVSRKWTGEDHYSSTHIRKHHYTKSSQLEVKTEMGTFSNLQPLGCRDISGSYNDYRPDVITEALAKTATSKIPQFNDYIFVQEAKVEDATRTNSQGTTIQGVTKQYKCQGHVYIVHRRTDIVAGVVGAPSDPNAQVNPLFYGDIDVSHASGQTQGGYLGSFTVSGPHVIFTPQAPPKSGQSGPFHGRLEVKLGSPGSICWRLGSDDRCILPCSEIGGSYSRPGESSYNTDLEAAEQKNHFVIQQDLGCRGITGRHMQSFLVVGLHFVYLSDEDCYDTSQYPDPWADCHYIRCTFSGFYGTLLCGNPSGSASFLHRRISPTLNIGNSPSFSLIGTDPVIDPVDIPTDPETSITGSYGSSIVGVSDVVPYAGAMGTIYSSSARSVGLQPGSRASIVTRLGTTKTDAELASLNLNHQIGASGSTGLYAPNIHSISEDSNVHSGTTPFSSSKNRQLYIDERICTPTRVDVGSGTDGRLRASWTTIDASDQQNAQNDAKLKEIFHIGTQSDDVAQIGSQTLSPPQTLVTNIADQVRADANDEKLGIRKGNAYSIESEGCSIICGQFSTATYSYPQGAEPKQSIASKPVDCSNFPGVPTVPPGTVARVECLTGTAMYEGDTAYPFLEKTCRQCNSLAPCDLSPSFSSSSTKVASTRHVTDGAHRWLPIKEEQFACRVLVCPIPEYPPAMYGIFSVGTFGSRTENSELTVGCNGFGLSAMISATFTCMNGVWTVEKQDMVYSWDGDDGSGNTITATVTVTQGTGFSGTNAEKFLTVLDGTSFGDGYGLFWDGDDKPIPLGAASTWKGEFFCKAVLCDPEYD